VDELLDHYIRENRAAAKAVAEDRYALDQTRADQSDPFVEPPQEPSQLPSGYPAEVVATGPLPAGVAANDGAAAAAQSGLLAENVGGATYTPLTGNESRQAQYVYLPEGDQLAVKDWVGQSEGRPPDDPKNSSGTEW
jgi:hypothetical protein